MVTSKPISSKPAFVRLAFPMYQGDTSGSTNIFDITDHLVSFEHVILGDTNSDSARQFTIDLINPSDNVEKVILNQYENFVPSIGSANKSADAPRLPIALIEFGYGSDLEDGKSKIHAAMMMKAEYIFTAGKEKSLRIILYSVETLARRGHATLDRLYSTQVYKAKGTSAVWPLSLNNATTIDEANFNLEIKSMSEIVTDLILTALNDCGDFVEFEEADVDLGTFFSNRLNRFNSMHNRPADSPVTDLIKTLMSSFKKIGDSGPTDFLSVKRFCETVGLKLVIKGLDLDQGRNLTATKSQGTPGVATEDPSPDQDEAGSSDELPGEQPEDEILIEALPCLKADFETNEVFANILDPTRYNVGGYLQVTPLMAHNVPVDDDPNSTTGFKPMDIPVYYLENFGPVLVDPVWPVQRGEIMVLQKLTPEGSKKFHDACLQLSREATKGRQDALEDIGPPVIPEITPPERSDLKSTINLAAVQVALEIPAGHDTLVTLALFIDRIGATFSHYTGPVPRVSAIAKTLLNTRALSLPLISFSDIKDWTLNNYKTKVFVLPDADLRKRLKTSSSNEEKRIRSFPHLHQDNTEDYNEIVLEYGASDSIIQTFTWDGDLSFLLANIGSQPSPVTLEELDDYGALLQKRPLRFLAQALSDETEFQGADAAEDMDSYDGTTPASYNETFSPYHGIWDTASKISRIKISEAMVKRLTEFVARVTETNETFQHHIARISQTHGADAETAVKVLVDTFLRAEKARAAFNIPTPKPPSLTEKWLSPGVIAWTNKFFGKRTPVMFNSEDDTLHVTSDYILNKVDTSMYAFQLSLQTLGLPELDSVEDLLGINDRVIKLLIHDISKEKTSKGVPVYHWLSGKYVLQGITHSIGLKGYQSSLHLIRLPYAYPEHPLTIGDIS